MSDPSTGSGHRLESRLAEGLDGTADRAPHPADLAAGARARLRRRRRTTAAVVAAALAVVAVPVGLGALGGDLGGPAPAGSGDGGIDADWRLETWRDLSVRVPPGWTLGGLLTCPDGRSIADRPLVTRPGGDCDRDSGLGVQFSAPASGELPPGTEGAVQQYSGDRYPDGAWIGYVGTQHAAVWVVSEDRTTTRQVLDSASPVGEVDGNGCATRLEMSSYSGSEQMSVCRYDRVGWLEQSELLDPEQTRLAAAALEAAPPSGGGRDCRPGLTVRSSVVVLVGGDQFSQVVLGGSCAGIDDVADDGGLRRLTRDVLHWALSPGWSGELSFLSYAEDPEGFRLRRP